MSELSSTTPIRIEGDIPVNLSISNGSKYLFISKDQRAFTHAVHKYPAKFFPELPRWIISRFSEQGDIVLDPFMGSGTTNLEAMLLGRNSIGVDVDPFSRFLAKAKTTVLPTDELIEHWETLELSVRQYREPREPNGIPEFPYRDNWFKPYVLNELSHIKAQIEKMDCSRQFKTFFLVIFSSIIRQVSEADNNCTRTVVRKNQNKQVNPGKAIDLFLKRGEKQVRGMCELYQANPSGGVQIPDDADARKMPGIASNSVDLATTSPPYANAVDYPRTHQLEIYWLGFANGSLQPLKEQHVGTEIVRSVDYSTLHETGCEIADNVIEQIFEVDRRRAYIAAKYLIDMFFNLKEIYRVLKPGSAYVVVVGNNLMKGIPFETWRYLEAMAPEFGYRVEFHFVSTIINHFIKVPRKERINDDHILVLRK